MDFDKDGRERNYYNVDQSCKIVGVSEEYSPDDVYGTGLSIAGKGLLSDGSPCNIEIPFFQNNQFNQFTYCGMFIFYDITPADEMGLVFNGYVDDCYPGSIKIVLSASRTLRAGVVLGSGYHEITNSLAVNNFALY